MPDYAALNVDADFLGWLADVDPLSGATRQDYLNSAFERFDVERTATLFNTFKAANAPPPPPPPREPNRQLARQVAPGTSKSSAKNLNDPSTRVWSLSEVEQFYREASRGEYRGKAEEQARIEAEIDLAVAEGRVR